VNPAGPLGGASAWPLPGAALGALTAAEDALARLDERLRTSPIREGFVSRTHFQDACAGLWLAGELVSLEDLVLHDARMDIRSPTHALTRAQAVLRARRRIAGAALWVEGEFVHAEDLVLHDAAMDVRSPSHELARAQGYLNLRRRAAAGDPKHLLSPEGILGLDRAARRRRAELSRWGRGE
jgi:hypothetical protein